MRPLIFLFPHNRMDVGGNSAQVRFVEACCHFTQARIAFYGERIDGHPYLDDVLADRAQQGEAPIFVIHWGPDIAMLLDALQGRDVVYVAHSTGWGMALPPKVPILCVSRNTMAFWGRHAPNSFIAFIPNVVAIDRQAISVHRDVDVLVQVRKSSRYLIDRLVPALSERCRVTVLDGWVDDLSAWFRRSKVYLYDSLEHWADVGASEGFGLPPLEAMGHGCQVFSSVNDALADYLDPGFNCRKIRVHSLAWDVEAVLRAVEGHDLTPPTALWFETYSSKQIATRLETTLVELEHFFKQTAHNTSDIEDLWAIRRPTSLQRAKRAAKVLVGR